MLTFRADCRVYSASSLPAYPYGLVLAHFHWSMQQSSIVRSARHPKTSNALSVLAYTSAASPGRRSTIFIGIVFPEAFSNAATSSNTDVLFPVPRLTVINPAFDTLSVSFFTAAT